MSDSDTTIEPISGLDTDFDSGSTEDLMGEEHFEWAVSDELLAGIGSSTLFESEEITLPPERVRFATLASLLEEGSERPLDGVVTNLSVDGVACVCPADFDPGARVRVSFRVSLGGDPIEAACEVMWRRYPDEGDPDYGLRFLNLEAEYHQEVTQVVTERFEGRAGEWPLPTFPDVIEDDATASMSPWLAGAAGMALGVGLAVAIAIVPAIGEQSDFTDSGPRVVKAAAASVLVAASDSLASIEAIEEEAEPTIVPLVLLGDIPVVKESSPRADEPAQAEASSADDEAANGSVSSTTTSEDLRFEGVGADEAPPKILHAVSDDTGFEIRLLTDGPIVGHKTFWLSEPRRFVVDVPGCKTGFSRLSYEIDHPLAQRLRVGQHNDKVRFVLETDSALSASPELRTEGNAVIVRFPTQS